MAGSIEAEKLQCALKRVPPGGVSVRDHVSKVLGFLARAEEEGTGTDEQHLLASGLEAVSAFVKSTAFRSKHSWGGEEFLDAKAQDLTSALLRIPASVPSPWPVYSQQRLRKEYKLMDLVPAFEWAGISLGREGWWQLARSIDTLIGQVPEIRHVRLWGKVLTRGAADYYVLETEVVGEQATPATDVELPGLGANRWTYWTTSCPLRQPWERLPLADPELIRSARRFRKLLSGNLDAPVLSDPQFNGTERDLLRSQIARITAGTSLAPDGYWVQREEGEEVEGPLMTEAEEYAWPEDGCATVGAWVHAEPHLLMRGTCQYPEVDPEENEELFKKIEAEQEADPPVPLLRKCDEDTPENSCWVVKRVGDMGEYEGAEGKQLFCASVLRSLLWPGAATVQQEKQYASIYVGYATKAAQPKQLPFSPAFPAPIQTEPKDAPECPEPFPLDEDNLTDGGEFDGEGEEEGS